jgi:hypothetical protein
MLRKNSENQIKIQNIQKKIQVACGKIQASRSPSLIILKLFSQFKFAKLISICFGK